MQTSAGNELADKLAKEAAEEAKEMDDSSVVVTMEDVKSATKKSGIKKWQDMWEKSERGRALYIHRPEVNFNLKHSFKTTKGEKAISQLRTGYANLNEYLFKCGLNDSDKCECGEIETCDHFLLRCCSGAPCPTDYPLRSVSGRFGSAVLSRDCSCVQALSHLLDARQRARVFETFPTKTELWLWL